MKFFCCPNCRSKLSKHHSGSYICKRCKNFIPEMDGIPVLLKNKNEVDEAFKNAGMVQEAQLDELFAGYSALDSYGVREASFSEKLSCYRDMLFELVKFAAICAGIRKLSRKLRETENAMKKTELKSYGGFDITAKEIMAMKLPFVQMYDGKIMKVDSQHVRRLFFSKLRALLKENRIHAKKILEIGCGPLNNFQLLEELWPDSELYGLDYNINRLRIGRKIHGKKYNVCCGDGMNLPFSDNSLDVALTVHVMERFGNQNIPVMLNEIKRVAKYLIAIEPVYEYQNLFGKANILSSQYPTQLVKKIENCGFTVLKVYPTRSGNPSNLSVIIIAENNLPQAD